MCLSIINYILMANPARLLFAKSNVQMKIYDPNSPNQYTNQQNHTDILVTYPAWLSLWATGFH